MVAWRIDCNGSHELMTFNWVCFFLHSRARARAGAGACAGVVYVYICIVII